MLIICFHYLPSVYKICGGARRDDEDGAAMYAVVTISLFATAIGFFIGMMSFKKKKYDEWDRQGKTTLSMSLLNSTTKKV